MKPLCVIDTCSLIYLSEIELAHRSLHRWLWDEFDVTYSEAVWDEIKRNARKMGQDASWIRRNGDEYVSSLSAITTYERALFGPPFYRTQQIRKCSRCKQPQFKRMKFNPDLTLDRDKGERHNCCVALSTVIAGEHRQVIFMTDDRRALRDYVEPVFDTFPLGHIWSSHDFVLYLFLRHKKYISQGAAKNALRDVNAKAAHPTSSTQEWIQKLKSYRDKVARINKVLSRTGGFR